MPTRKYHSIAEKQHIINERAQSGETDAIIAMRHGIQVNQLVRWKTQETMLAQLKGTKKTVHKGRQPLNRDDEESMLMYIRRLRARNTGRNLVNP
jgi:transposase-like protein